MNPPALNLAYQFVATVLMIAHANLFCSTLDLAHDQPISELSVRDGSHVGPPRPGGFSGSILTDHYFFGFGRGHLANFYKRGFTPNSDAEVRKRNSDLAKQSSLINTNEAHQLATNWLTRIGVDVYTLESKYKLKIIQWLYYPEVQTEGQLRPMERRSALLPVFQVEWRGALMLQNRKFPERAIVSMTISGVTKELLEYHLLDDSLMMTSPIEITEPEKLLAVSDEDFKTFDATKRKILVSEFASVSNSTIKPGASQNGKENVKNEK